MANRERNKKSLYCVTLFMEWNNLMSAERKVRGDVKYMVTGRCNGRDIRELREEKTSIYHYWIYVYFYPNKMRYISLFRPKGGGGGYYQE